jgi:transcriptional regulator of met regulon
MAPPSRSAVLTIRVPLDLDRRIAQAARRRKSTKSAVLREAISLAFAGGPAPEDPAREARRQSLLVSGRPSEQEALDFLQHAADDLGWR